MNERLLQFIWQFQYFNKSELCTGSGDEVQIIFPGHHNTNQGPDFTGAKIRIGHTMWAGTVELHLKTSDWFKHHHQHDNHYNNVILHVVWENDGDRSIAAADSRRNGITAPTVELKDRVSKLLLRKYEELLFATSFIPCEKNIHTVPAITINSWKERLLVERLLRKATTVEVYLQQSNYHWEETFWWLLARSFGMKVNADAFEAIARSIPLAVLGRQKHQVLLLEALLLGQAGLLRGRFTGKYPGLLQREYNFQKRKYNIEPVAVPLLFLRMRPVNFPTVRLAQLAMLVHQSAHLFSKIKDAESIKDVKSWFDVTAGDYWHRHYRFDELSAFKPKKPGQAMIDTIIINTILPVLFAYGQYHKEQKYRDRALQWLAEMAPEKNAITRRFELMGMENTSAYDSQALIELKTQYCDYKMCLDCGIGNSLLKAGNG